MDSSKNELIQKNPAGQSRNFRALSSNTKDKGAAHAGGTGGINLATDHRKDTEIYGDREVSIDDISIHDEGESRAKHMLQ